MGKKKKVKNNQKWDGIFMTEFSLGSGEVGEGSGQESFRKEIS